MKVWTVEEATALTKKAAQELAQAEQQHASAQRQVNEASARIVFLRGRLAGLRETLVADEPPKEA
jgi:chromosome segregation ATPase